jgi:iron only hydrogenase large subunit-like protein
MSSTRDAPTDDKVTTANRPSFRKLADTQSDFIQPSLACIKPVQVAKVEKPNHRVLLLEDSHDDEATMKAKAPIARITLNDCLACAGCITSAESMLITQQSIEEFESMLRASGSKYDLVIVSVSAAARAAIAEHSGLSLRETHSRMAGFLKGLGVHTMLDCGTASNLGLVEQAAEFVARYRAHAAASSPATGGSPMQLVPPPPPPPSTALGRGALAAPTALPVRSEATSEATSGAASPTASPAALSAASTSQLPLPLITSSCPGWVCYAEKLCGELVLSHMSSVKSAQQIAGTLIKYVHAAGCGVPPERVCHVSVMPCFDKKLEASRDEFFNAAAGEHGCRDVDCVLSSAELLEMVTKRGLPGLAHAPAVLPDVTPPFASLVRSPDASDRLGGGGLGGDGLGVDGPIDGLGGLSLTYAAPGASGGHADYVFRAAAFELFGIRVPEDTPLPWVQGRNADLLELSLKLEGKPVLHFCRAYGFRNIQNLVRRLKNGKCTYHFVELMACPGGCANGGGQPKPPPADVAARTANVEARYIEASSARRRQPLDDPSVAALYADGSFLQGGPLGPNAQRALHTSFKAVVTDEASSLTMQW